MKCSFNFTVIFILFSCATFGMAKDPQFKLKNNSDGMIKVKLYKPDGKLLDTADRSAMQGDTITIESTGKLSRIDVLYMVSYTAGDTFVFNNVTDNTTYYLNFTTRTVKAGTVTGGTGADAISVSAEVGELSPQTGTSLKDNITAAQIKRKDRQ